MTSYSRSAVHAAERQLEQSKRESLQHYRRARSALRAAAGRPTFLSVVTGVGVLLGIWFSMRRTTRVSHKRRSALAPLRDTIAGWTARAGIRYLATWARDQGARPHRSNA